MSDVERRVRNFDWINFPITSPRRSLFLKYFVTLFIAVVVPVMLGAASEAWFGYRDQRRHLNELLQAESRLAADRIQTFIDGIRDRLGRAISMDGRPG
jgi:adenylate cyclase